MEVTASAWIVNSAGQLVSSGRPVDLVSDLNVGQNQPTFFGQFVFKPGRKHRIVVEGTPFRESGANTVNRSIVYRGQTFNVSQNIQSSADLNYFFAGYQYNLVSGPRGYLGLSVGGAYLSATGSILASASQVPAPGTETIGLPLAGLEFHVFPFPTIAFCISMADCVHGVRRLRLLC